MDNSDNSYLTGHYFLVCKLFHKDRLLSDSLGIFYGDFSPGKGNAPVHVAKIFKVLMKIDKQTDHDKAVSAIQ